MPFPAPVALPDGPGDADPSLQSFDPYASDLAPEHGGVDLSASLGAWVADLRAHLVPADQPWLTPALWSARTLAFYAAGGETGLRRRQAAALQPAFATVLPLQPRLATAIDAGRPFEPELLDLARGLGATGLTLSHLRRLRTWGDQLPPPNPSDVLREVSHHRADILPRTRRGWIAFLDNGCAVARDLTRLGLDVRALAGPLTDEWDLSPAIPDISASAAAIGMRDMATSLGRSLPMAEPGDPQPGRPPVEVAGRILFAGKTLAACHRLQRRWHASLEAFESLTRIDMDLEWPALFGPYVAPGGIRVACLTTGRALIAEGMTGADPDGVAGLSHCVGGYAQDCARGGTHVASVRSAPDADGRRMRLSTVELKRTPEGVRVIQHLGFRNGAPSLPAEAAVAGLLLALNEGRHALAPTSGAAGGVGQPIGMPDPDLAFALWAPFLRRGIARGGLPALAEAVRAASRGA